MRKILNILLAVFLLCGVLTGTALAVDNSRSYNFNFTANGKQEITAAEGDIITMVLVLERTDSSDSADMYATQAEFWYDDTFFEFVEGSALTYDGVEFKDVARRTGGRAVYLNFLSQGGGTPWSASVQMGTFQMRVIGKSGSSVIDSKNCLVSTKDGMDTYSSVDNDLTVVISTACCVTFDSMGGSKVKEQTVYYGEKVTKPEDPKRDGYSFEGWYKDLDRTEKWDFDNDVVKENMTLYANWCEGGVVPTGDNSHIRLWLIIAIVALILIVVVVYEIIKLKKKKN